MSSNKIFTSKFFIICVAVFAITFGLSFIFEKSNIELETENSADKIESDTEIALIYFGCSTCPAANDERLPEVLAELALKAKESAVSQGYEFTFIGTSNESNISQGLEYLTGVASFDEIALGNGMENMVLQHYVWEKFDNPLSASTPQIIISKRVYEKRMVNGQEVIHPHILSEKILVRRVGVKRMNQLINRNDFFKLP